MLSVAAVRSRGVSVATCACLTFIATQASAQVTTSVDWDVLLRTPQPATEFRAIASSDSALFVATADRSTLEPRETSETHLRVWTVGLDGQRRAETELTEMPASESNTRTIRDISALSDGGAVVLVDFVAGRPSLVHLDARGTQVATRRVLPDNRTTTLMRMVPMGEGRHLLIGHERFDAIAVLVDANGAALWDRVFDRGRQDFFVDGVAAANGGAILVGNSGTYDPMRGGESTIWVARYDATGLAGSEVSFSGRYGRIAALADGGVALVYDRGNALERDMRVKRIGPDMRELWDVAIGVAREGVGDFRIGVRADGTLIVAGGASGLAQLVYLDASGRVSGSWMATPGPRAVDVGAYGLVIDRDGDVVIAGSHVQATGPSNANFQVRVRRLAGGPAQRGL